MGHTKEAERTLLIGGFDRWEVPRKLQQWLLENLHRNHRGVVKDEVSCSQCDVMAWNGH